MGGLYFNAIIGDGVHSIAESHPYQSSKITESARHLPLASLVLYRRCNSSIKAVLQFFTFMCTCININMQLQNACMRAEKLMEIECNITSLS